MTDAQTKLLAYYGDAEARKLLDNPCRCIHKPCRNDCLGKQNMSDAEWIKGLIPLVEAAAVRECPECKGVGSIPYLCSTSHRVRCPVCEFAKTVTDPHALLRLCLAVAKVCWTKLYNELPEGTRAGDPRVILLRDIKYSIDACQAYIDDPINERLDAWRDARRALDPKPEWVPSPPDSIVSDCVVLQLNATAKLLGDRFRDVMKEMKRG